MTTNHRKPPANNHKLSDNCKPPANNHKPANDHKPPENDSKLPANDHKQPANSHIPVHQTKKLTFCFFQHPVITRTTPVLRKTANQ